MSLRVDFTHGFRSGPAEWEKDFAAGRVPEPAPYGLQRLADHDIELIARPKPGGLRRYVNGAGYKVDLLHWGHAGDPRRRGQADISLCWDERTGIPVSLTGWPGASRIPVVSGCIWVTDETKPRRLHIEGLRRMQAVWVLSTAQIPVLAEMGVPGERLHYVPMGISPDFYSPQDVPVMPHQVMCVGHDRHRDYPTLIGSVAAAQRVPGLADARLELVTPDPVDLPAEVGNRTLHLPSAELRRLYNASAVVALALHPNVHVSGVTAMLEAMACARPVVVTDTPGMAGYIEDGVTGRLVPPGDPQAMADAISALMLDPDAAAAMGEAARASVLKEFSTATLAINLAQLLHATAGR
jgi:glycosyltransferase involved in cell wall biosynthesis